MLRQGGFDALLFWFRKVVEQIAGPDLERPRDIGDVFQGQILLPTLRQSDKVPVNIRHLGKFLL